MMGIKLKLAGVAVIAFFSFAIAVVAVTSALAESGTETSAPPTTGSSSDADFARQFSADWQSINLNLMHVNAASPNNRNGGMQDSQSLSIQAALTVVDPAHVLGFDRMGSMTVTRIVDDSGHDLTGLAINNARDDRWYSPLSYGQQFEQGTQRLVEYLQPQQFNVALTLDSRLPHRLAAVEGYLNVLTYDRMEHVDVPYAANGPAVTVVPDAKLRFAVANKEGNSFNYQLVNDVPNNERSFDGQVSATQALPERLIAMKYLIDASGNPIGNGPQNMGGNFAGNGAGNSSGGMAGADKIAAIRFEVAIGLHERKVSVTLKGIDLPVLATAGNMLPTEPADPSPFEYAEQELARRLQNQRDRAAQNGWTDAKDQHVRDLWKAFTADFNAGAAAKVVPADVMGLRPDVTSYGQYVGSYRITPPRMQRPGAAPTTAPAADRSVAINVERDERGRLVLKIPEGKKAPLAPRDGALFGAFDPMFMPSDPLDSKSEPKLAGLWVIRSGGQTTLVMDNGRRMQPMRMQPEPATQP